MRSEGIRVARLVPRIAPMTVAMAVATVMALLVFLSGFDGHCVTASTVTIHAGSGLPRISVKVDSPSELQYRGVVRAELDASCAAASLATVLTHYLDRATTEQVALSYLFGQRKVAAAGVAVSFSLLDIRNVLGSLGYTASGLRGTAASVRDQAPFPCIVLIEIGNNAHFTVLRAMSDTEAFFSDPILGNIALESSEFEKRWNGVLLAIERSGEGGESEAILDLRPPGTPDYASIHRALGSGYSTDMSKPDEF